MTFEDIPYEDDWLVMWRGLAVGRILKQSGVAYGKPNWFWSITYSGTVKPARGSGVAIDLEDGKAGSKAAWAELRARLTDKEIERFRRQETATEDRLNDFRAEAAGVRCSRRPGNESICVHLSPPFSCGVADELVPFPCAGRRP